MNELFCEDIIVLSPIEKIYLFKLNEINEREIDIKHIPKKLLGKTTTNIKFAFNHIGLSIKNLQIKPTWMKCIANENYNNQSSDYIQMLQVDLNKFPSDKVIEILCNAEILIFSSNNSNFINDIGFTEDFSGLINKEEVITRLVTNRDFRMQGFYGLTTHTILDIFFKILENA